MKSSFVLVSALVLLACMAETWVDAGANGRLPLIVNPQTLGSSKETVTVYPCTSNCKRACCDCNIEKIPPVCVKCCGELPPFLPIN